MIPLIFTLLAQTPLTSTTGSLSRTEPLVLKDEGTRLGSVSEINCSGAGVTCTKSGVTGTIIVAGGGGGGAPVDAQYWTGASDATLTQEKNLGALSTGLVLNTAGVPSAYAGSTCGANQYATQTNASGILTCAQPAFSDITGTLAVGRGGTGQTTITTNQVYVGTALDTLTATTLPSCSNGTTSKLLFNSSTQTFACGTDQTGGGGGSANVVEVDVDFGTGANSVSTVVTGQTWVTSTSKILCGPTLVATSSRAEGEEDAVIEGLVPAIHSRIAGTGFTLVVAVPLGVASGVFKFHCTGA